MWGGTKPQLMKTSPIFADLQKYQFIHPHLERIALGGAENRLEESPYCNTSSEMVTPARKVKAMVKFSAQCDGTE